MHSTSPHQSVTARPLPLRVRRLLGFVIIAIAAGIVCAVAMVAVDEDEGIGTDSALSYAENNVVTAGKMFALAAAALMFLQFALSARFRLLDRIFGLNRLLTTHRILGVSAVALGTLHPLLVYAPQMQTIGPFRLDLWPEIIGIMLLTGLWTAVCLSLWRVFLGLPFQRWWLMHRMGVFTGMVMLAIHAFNVSDDFEKGILRFGFIAAFLVYAAVFSWVKAIKPTLLRIRPYTVAQVARVGRNVHAVELAPSREQVFAYLPGQFAFVTFSSSTLSGEEHHFTLSSTPTRGGSIIFTVKSSGDFTSRIGQLRSGETAVIDGPYGLFSHLARTQEPDREIIMIAGGIGITPMLSMLRYMVDVQDMRRVTLVWSNRTREDILCREEIESITAKLPSIAIHHVLTQQADCAGLKGRLNQGMLQKLLEGCSRDSAIFVCGPPDMMNSVCTALKNLKFKSRNIYTERFSL